MGRLTVINYRSEVERVIAAHHARLEMGLGHAREQEAFVRRVADVLTRNRVPFTWGLNTDFDAAFRLPENVMAAPSLLKTLFSGCVLAHARRGLVLSDAENEYIQVRFWEAGNGL